MELSDPTVQAGVIAAIASVVGAAIGTGVTLWLGIRKLRREYLLEHQSEALVKRLLSHERWRLRTFKTIKYHVAGFKDDELRQILIRAGALRFQDVNGVEVWGLLERNVNLIEREHDTVDN